MKLVLILLGIIAVPLITMWAEYRDGQEGKREVWAMADRDARRTAARTWNRRLKYTVAGTKKARRSGNSTRAKV